MRLMATGFEAFGDAAFNPAEHVVRRLIADPPTADFLGLVLPVEYGAAAEQALKAAADFEPDLILLFGLAGDTPVLRLERLGRNTVTAAACDNAGRALAGETILPGAPDAIETVVDVDAIALRLRDRGLAVRLSDDAGGYVCNDIYMRLLAGQGAPVLFVHVPWAHRPATAADFAEPPADAHERIARAVVAEALAVMAAAPSS